MANFNFNQVIIAGKLTKDPELKQTSGGTATVTVTVAVNRKVQSNDPNAPKADFFNVTAWRKTAEFVSQYFRKGASICITGTLQNRSWTGNDGQKHFVTEIVADRVDFVDGKNDNAAPVQANAPGIIPGVNAQQKSVPPLELDELEDGEPLPF